MREATIASVFQPEERLFSRLYDLCLILGGSLLVAVSAQIAVGWPVPFTGQTFAVLVVASVLGARRGALAILAYILEGVCGLPVFSQGRAGLWVLFGPSGGYIVGFAVAAIVVGTLAEKGWDKWLVSAFAAMVLGNIVIYIFGLGWLSLLMGPKAAIRAGLYPFVVGDLIKICLAGGVLPAVWKAIGRPAGRG